MSQSKRNHRAFGVQGSLTLHYVSGLAEVREGLFSALEDLLGDLFTGPDITDILDGYDLVREGVLVRYLRLRPFSDRRGMHTGTMSMPRPSRATRSRPRGIRKPLQETS